MSEPGSDTLLLTHEDREQIAKKKRRPGKRSSEETEMRRRQVYELRMAGLTQAQIAKACGVHLNTIQNDLKIMREEDGESQQKVDVNAEIGAHIRFLRRVSEEAMGDAATEGDKRKKAAALATALKARQQMIQLQLDTGVLPKAQSRELFEDLMHHEGQDIRKMGVSALMDLLQQKVVNVQQLLTPAAEKQE